MRKAAQKIMEALEATKSILFHLFKVFAMNLPTINSGLRDNHTRGSVLPNTHEQVHEKTDLELVTWLVINEDKA